MTFLQPLAWFWMFLILPVLVFYLFRQRGKNRPVSTMLFWDQVSPQVHNRPFWRRLRNWLSLLLQILFIVLLSVSLAHPVFDSQVRNALRRIYVIDPSASMQAVKRDENNLSVWDIGMQRVRDEINKMSWKDESLIIMAGDPPVVLHGWTGNPRYLLNALKSVLPAPIDLPVKDAVRLAKNLQKTTPGSEIILVSDGIWEDLERPPGTEEGFKRWNIGLSRDHVLNLGITRFSARRSPASPGYITLETVVTYVGPEAYTGNVILKKNGILADARHIQVTREQNWTHQWREADLEETRFELELEVPVQDCFAPDDSASLLVPSLERVRIIFNGTHNPYLEAAFRSLPEVEIGMGPFPIDPAASHEGDRDSNKGDPITCVVFEGSAPAEWPDKSASFLFNPQADGPWGTFSGLEQSAVFAEWDSGHPLLQFTSLEAVNLSSASRYEPVAGAEILVKGLNGPIIFGRWETPSPWILFGFDLEATDLPLRTAFPVLLGNLIQNLRANPEGIKAVLPGPDESRLGFPLNDPANETTGLENNNLDFIPGALSFPLWWYFGLAGLCWSLLEWWLYTRRITE